uniref:Tyrosine specific protein phosphatases domain-containing protein n=1 Tax=Xiphophorus couchianus TaxID=32473 RepID=A0A3B5KZQ7_9TELE
MFLWPSLPSSLSEPIGPCARRSPPTAAAASRLWRLRSGRTTSKLSSVDLGHMPDTLDEWPALKHCRFEDINECINASTEKRKRVLVHCRDGFSLAPMCIIQYLMVKQNMRLIAAYELLRAKYPVNIKECHQNVLVSLERALWPGGESIFFHMLASPTGLMPNCKLDSTFADNVLNNVFKV